MGLASKLAAAQSAAGGLGGLAGGAAGRPPTSQYGGAPPSSYGGQQGYGAAPSYPPAGSQQVYPPVGSQQQYSQQQYSAPSGPPPVNSAQRPGQPAPYPPPQSSTGYQQSSQYSQQGGYGGQQSYGQSAPYQQGQGAYGQQQAGGQYGQQAGVPPPAGYGAPQQSGYGAGQQQNAYGGAPPVSSGAGDAGIIETLLRQTVQDQNIASFYPNPQALGQIAQQVARSGSLDRLAQDWRLPKEIAMDLVKISLFDVVLYVDDSGSMAFEEGGERIEDLKLIVSRVSYAASLFDADGISVRFMNNNINGDGIKDEAGVQRLLSQIRYSGLTPLGTQLQNKILGPMLLGPARQGQLQKPLLIIAITDGTPAGEDRRHVFNVILNARRELERTRYGPDALSLTFAQVGNDQKARAFLEEIDNDPQIGSLVDTTSNFEQEQDDFLKTTGQELTPELWLIKLLLGSIDSSYDLKDEKR